MTFWHFLLNNSFTNFSIMYGKLLIGISCEISLLHYWRKNYYRVRIITQFSIKFKSGFWDGQSITDIFSSSKKALTFLAVWQGPLPCMKVGGCKRVSSRYGSKCCSNNCLCTSAFTLPCNRISGPGRSAEITP